MHETSDNEHARSAVGLMFSGGRDSALAAAYYAEKLHGVHLITFENTGCYPVNIAAARVAELRVRWPIQIIEWSQLSAAKILRDIALRDIAADVTQYGCNLVCLGSALAMVARSIHYCLSRSISLLAVGYSGYQQHFPEQSPAAIGFLTEFARDYSIDLRCPMSRLTTEEQARDLLESLGLSPKALESSGLWDWTYPERVDPTVVLRYLQDKRDIATRYIALLQDFSNARDSFNDKPSA